MIAVIRPQMGWGSNTETLPGAVGAVGVSGVSLSLMIWVRVSGVVGVMTAWMLTWCLSLS